jgi:hypothetical protein
MPFVPVDLSHPAFEDIDTRINVAVPPLFPVALGIMEDKFDAEGLREISRGEGQYVLLLEKKMDEWVLAMIPESREIGHVPSDFVREIGAQLGVLLESPAGVMLGKGEYLAVVGNATEQTLTVVTEKGETMEIRKDIVGIFGS